jgi:hypothetical protein
VRRDYFRGGEVCGMSSQNDSSLVAALKMPDAPHLQPLSQTIGSLAFELKDQVQSRSNTVDRMNPLSAASMIDLIYRIKRRITEIEVKHGLTPVP